MSKLPADVDGDGLYSVCFPASREEFQFKVEDMRKQMEWANGDWIPVEDEVIFLSLFFPPKLHGFFLLVIFGWS